MIIARTKEIFFAQEEVFKKKYQYTFNLPGGYP